MVGKTIAAVNAACVLNIQNTYYRRAEAINLMVGVLATQRFPWLDTPTPQFPVCVTKTGTPFPRTRSKP